MAHYSRWIEHLGGNLSQIGWIMGSGAAAGLFFRPWLAQFINQFGAKTTWAMGYAIFSVASLANLMLNDLSLIIYIIRAANVLGAAVVFASSLTYISQVAPERRRTEAIGILGVGGFLGMLIGPFLGDVFLGSEQRSYSDFVVLFLAAAAANILPAILLIFVRPPHHRKRENQQGQHWLSIGEFVNTIREYWPGAILVVNMTFGVCMSVPFVFVASYIDEVPLRINGLSEIGYFFFFYAGPALFLRITLRRLPDRIGASRVLIAGLFFMSAGMFCFCLVTREYPQLLALPALFTGFGHSLMFHTMTSLTIQKFPTEVRGTASALALMMLDLGMFTGAPVLGLIGDLYGYSTLFISIAALCMATTVYYLQSLRVEDPASLGRV